MIRIHFSDYFAVPADALAEHGAFNVSFVNDLPLFIDPFLLFNSHKKEYQHLHDEMIRYVRFLRDKAVAGVITDGLLRAWFTFPEIRQNWLGYSLVGNRGSGLGMDFARSLLDNLNSVFASFGSEQVTRGSHLEKLTLIESGVGRDNVSDFCTNLIKDYLLGYSQQFALRYLPSGLRRAFAVPKVRFNYKTETWESAHFTLPWNEEENDYVILTPKDILTKDEVWISRRDLFHEFEGIVAAVPNAQLRAQINNYFLRILPKAPGREDEFEAIAKVLRRFPGVVEHYIRYKEDHGDEAVANAERRVAESDTLFVRQLSAFIAFLSQSTAFYKVSGTTSDEVRDRILFLKDVIENKEGHRMFYLGGQPIRRESDLHILFRLTWLGTPSDVSREVNDGRGPADFKISRGAFDKTLVEFKLAANSKLRRNLETQAEIYQRASDAPAAWKVIVYFTEAELTHVQAILREVRLSHARNIILIDARDDNKPSASAA